MSVARDGVWSVGPSPPGHGRERRDPWRSCGDGDGRGAEARAARGRRAALVPAAPLGHTHEQDAPDHIRRLTPAAEPYRAWAAFSFTARSGRAHECDLLIGVPRGLCPVESKGHPGRVENTGSTWNFHGRDRMRTIENPTRTPRLDGRTVEVIPGDGEHLHPGSALTAPAPTDAAA
ncbi:NERD domain-containing protein [Streptomyces sp. ST2-7A]|uniref:NERD domain-containing protein n=1 Tax=Streptomyces sp. ST2-7A TaxID=2907214 RepID=UPI001F1A5A1A|nr:NERD domain-containing protein [Streptomyces sp. ST2-7A]MCE7083043.1 NERD domain-containing protein [Streptomyces sp. ST2-7A]